MMIEAREQDGLLCKHDNTCNGRSIILDDKAGEVSTVKRLGAIQSMAKLSLSIETVRSRIKVTFNKTGTGGRTGFARLATIHPRDEGDFEARWPAHNRTGHPFHQSISLRPKACRDLSDSLNTL
jgi:hypothetical protein